MPGASILVARAAQRAGAGLVSIGCLDENLLQVIPPAAPEAVLVDLVGAWSEADGLRAGVGVELAAGQPHARLFGPGIGDDKRARAWLSLLLGMGERVPLVLDADALNALDGEPERLRDATAPLLITPHPGEAARLAGREVPRDREGREGFARELAARSGALVCLKGHGTVVAFGDHALTNDTGNPGMATAGAGDVLAGMLVAYLAAFRDAASLVERLVCAAHLAVYLHGLAGDLAASAVGERALVASDLIAFLPAAWRHLEEQSAGGG
jgi:NAD(P)H-hydrate epimerase